ncbi:hypothetical protein PFFCH_03826 [Plasmodium falciparum FCH/4]|uniref:Glycosyl transferase family 1 domain-containing protein n=2 Tax=Plasmodium falciparum FCH/4 TaxID=1036724 RepID=A0A024VJJ7_PLAFA|nr:hypothetical protein PFFCH_03826 [Plasmodium falciparum FCH/4]
MGIKSSTPLAHQFILHAKTLGIKTIYTDHSLYSFSDKGCIHVNKLLKYCINDVDHSICVSHTNRENLVLRTESNPYKTSVIGNALDTTKFVPCISKRPKFPRINIIVISRLTYRKGIDLIVKVIPLVCQKYPFIKFIIGGEGPKRLLLEEMREKYHLHNSVVLLGKVKQENVKNILQTGHIFLNTSLTEAFCIAIIEAASCGLLVISTDVGGISEVLPHDMMILAKPNHIELCKAVDKALKIVQKVDSNLFHERISKYVCEYIMESAVSECNIYKKEKDKNIIYKQERKCCICMVSDFFYPNLGGIETHIFELSKNLIKKGFKVIVVTNFNNNRHGIRWMGNGIKVYYLPFQPFLDVVSFPNIIGTLPLCRNILYREKVDIVHGHQVQEQINK